MYVCVQLCTCVYVYILYTCRILIKCICIVHLSQRVLKQIVQNTGDREESRYKNKVCIHISPIYYMYICTYVYTYTGEPHICTNTCFNLLANVFSVFSVLFLMLWRRRSLLQAVLAAVTKFLWKLLLCVVWSWQKHVPTSMTMTTQSYDTLWLSCKLHCRYEVFVLLMSCSILEIH